MSQLEQALLRPAPPSSIQGTLALSLGSALAPPGAAWSPEAEARAHSDVRIWTRRFSQAALEIIGGDRPPHQLVRWASREVYLNLERRARLVSRAAVHRPGQTRVQPVRPRIASVHCFMVRDDVAECSVHAHYGDRSRAIAGRFERHRDRWICTALDFS